MPRSVCTSRAGGPIVPTAAAVLSVLAVAILTISAAMPARAVDPTDLDVLRLRLGMTDPQVEDVLLGQGVPAARIIRQATPCQDPDACGVTITAATRDGDLTISLAPTDPDAGRTVTRIVYVLKERASGEPEMIADSVADRFGRPDQLQPMTWCQRPTPDHVCPADQPSLRFLPRSLTLILADVAKQPAPIRQP